MIWIYHHLSNPSPTEGHLGYFQFLAKENKASMDICVQDFCVSLHSHFSGINVQDIAISHDSYTVSL